MPDGKWQCVASPQSEVKNWTELPRNWWTAGSFELSPAVMFSAARPARDNQPRCIDQIWTKPKVHPNHLLCIYLPCQFPEHSG
ncbi:MAG: hypothetical protein DMG76_14345 [Acidobacteria bacterium]|nr:MAG: hypothetical protein DMG76_14345 [Acidobacteriota bacterium]